METNNALTATLTDSEWTITGGLKMELSFSEPSRQFCRYGDIYFNKLTVILTPVKNLESGYITFHIPDDAGMEVFVQERYVSQSEPIMRSFFKTTNVQEAKKEFFEKFFNDYQLVEDKNFKDERPVRVKLEK